MGTGAWEKLTLVRDPTFRVSTDTQPDSGTGDSAVSIRVVVLRERTSGAQEQAAMSRDRQQCAEGSVGALTVPTSFVHC